MAYKDIFIAALFLLALSSKNSDASLANVYVSRYGNDSKTCGSRSQPCKSIAQAIRQVDYGGRIYLDGRGTEQHPYDCAIRSIHVGHHQGLYVNKSVILKRFSTTPRVLCIEGFHFQKTNDEWQTLRIELSGIVFRRTPLTCNDCQQVTIHNCSFHDTSRALAIKIQNITSFQLEIKGNSTFHNNWQCLHFLLLDNIGNKSRIVTITIKGANFEKNGFFGRRRSERGVMKIASSKDVALNPVYINIFCRRINGFDNQGPFINLNVPSAVTNETYKQVELLHNKLSFHTDWSDMKSKLAVRSLYFSHARETHAKFNAFSCHDNPSVQCIVVRSDRADIVVQGSTFYNQFVTESNGSCLSLEAIFGASLRIVNSSFHMNEAGAGGSLYANSTHGLLKINLTNVRFRECKARYGCAISIGRSSKGAPHTQWGPQNLHFILRNVTVEQWNGKRRKNRKCIAVDVLLTSGVVELEGSRFTKKTRTRGAGAFRVITTGGKTNVTISKCTFKDTAGNATKGTVVQILAGNGNAGMVTISDSFIVSYVHKKIALLISPKYRIKLDTIIFVSFKYGLQITSTPPKNSSQFPIDIVIDNCTFVDNIYDMLIVLNGPTSTQLAIKNTLFTSRNKTVKWDEGGNSYTICLIIPPLRIINSSKAVIELDNNTFQYRPPSYFALFFEGNKNVSIRRSLFRNCINSYRREWVNTKTGYIYETTAGAFSILLNPDKPRNLGCVQPNSMEGTHPSWSYNSHVLFEDTTFVENLGMTAGAVYISNGFTIFRRCKFHNNFGIEQSGHVYSAYGTGRVHFVHCAFLKTKESMIFNSSIFNTGIFLYSESGGPLELENTSMTLFDFNRNTYPVVHISSGGFVDMDKTSTIKCSEGQELLLENGTHFIYTEKNNSICLLNVTVLKYSCKSCPPGYYSLQKGVSRGLVVSSPAQCHPCPFGATCIESNVAAKPNFWGYLSSNQSQTLRFIACPEDYCPSTASAEYRSCNANRNGTLCGKCAKGFSATLFSAECRESTKCNDYSVWIVTLLLTFALALYLLKKPPVLHILGNQIFWFKNRGENRDREELDDIDDCGHFDSGYIKITFYFYQAAETVMVDPVEELVGKIPLIYFVTSAFNFHVQSIKQSLGCPFAGLTAVTKELVLSLTVFLTMANVVAIYVIQFVINMFMGKEKPSLVRYMAVILEVLLLGYERLAETSLKLMHCVSIGSGKWLFIDANVPCMQWWQYLLLAYIVIFVVPFIVVLYLGSSKLYRSFITAGEFLVACMIPLPFLIYWLIKGMLERRREDSTSVEVVNDDVLEILHGPFRPPSSGENGTLYWESVLIGRRLVLLLCEAFIENIMLRMVSMATACLLITLHHVLKKPYRDAMANKAETLSLVALSVIAIINLTKATLLSFGITIDEPSKLYLEALEWIEVSTLAFVPALVSILVAFAILSQLARLVLFLLKHFRHCCWKFCSQAWYVDQEGRPLLDTAERS